MSNRITVTEIAERLDIGKMSVYEMLEKGIIPGVRVGRNWIITRHAYEQWERTCGMRPEMPRSVPPRFTYVDSGRVCPAPV
jgi:excisionase family DNA binding protein